MSAVEADVLPPEPAKSARTKRSNGSASTAMEPKREGVDINTLLATAVQTGHLETMERVMAIRRELKQEAAREAFFAALSSFQSECPIIKKTKSVKDSSGATRYHYAPLDVIVRVVAPLLTKYGLSYTIESKIIGTGDEGALEAICKVYHEAGHMEESRFSVPVEPPKFMSKPQTFGAASTFAKRYAFVNALGILTGDDDNDAREAPSRTPPAARQPVSQPRQTPTAQRAEVDKANGNGKQKADLDPAGEGEAIDVNTVKGLAAAMEHATLGQDEFKKRFPKLAGLEQVKKTDTRTVMSWIADPIRN